MGMRMCWVREDYAALARALDAARRARADQAELAPGELVRRLRRGLQWSQRQLAKRAGMPRSLIGRVESGGQVELGSLRRLLSALGCELLVLPASEELLAHFRAKARERHRRDREFVRVCRELGIGRGQPGG